MFRPKEMREVNLLVAERDIAAVTRAIARLGMLQLLDVSYLGYKLPVESADRQELLRTYAAKERRVDALVATMFPGKPMDMGQGKAAPEQSLDQIEARIRQAEQEIKPVTERIAQIEQDVKHLNLLVHQLGLLSPLDIAIEDLESLEYLHLAVGTLPADNLDRLHTSLFHVPYVILPFRHEDDRVAIFAFASQDKAETLDRALKSAYFSPFELPQEFSGPLDNALEQMRNKMAEMTKEKEDLSKQLAELRAKWSDELLSLKKRVTLDRALAEARERFGRTDHVYLIAGWLPKESVPDFIARMKRLTEGRMVSEVNEPQSLVGGERRVPSALDNPPLFRAFEGITATYGQPSYGEIDPTPLVALSFVLMFGMMFGDVGHGLTLAAVGGLMASGLVAQLRRGAALAPILIACGLSSTVFGFLYGSIFGLENVLPALWLRPMDHIFSLLLATVAFGVVVLNIGLIFNMVNAWRKKDWSRLLFANYGLAGFLFYWAILGSALAYSRGLRLGIGIMLALIGLPALVIFFSEPLAKLIDRKRPILSTGLVAYLVQAFFEFFETVITYLSNTISYVRLGAFAVAHVGLSSMVFILADLTGGLVPLRWLIIVVGTLVIVGFEGLIVGIQTLRLEYYEFFTKFFHGEGHPYRPLSVPEA
jgi:V/A-type H+-transporting ATPase subunit I